MFLQQKSLQGRQGNLQVISSTLIHSVLVSIYRPFHSPALEFVTYALSGCQSSVGLGSLDGLGVSG